MIKVGSYHYENEEELLTRFKETLKPKYGVKHSNFSDYTFEDEEEYNTIMPWLKQNDYIIEEFPNVIRQQPDLKRFGYDMIRAEILKDQLSTSVAWKDRREFIDSLHIRKANDFPAFIIEPELQEIIVEVANGRGELHTQSLEDQLATLNNCVEYFLKQNGKFQDVNSIVFFDFFGQEEVKKFRRDTQIFRHATTETLKERNSWSREKKVFYCRLGILIVTNIYKRSTLSFLFA